MFLYDVRVLVTLSILLPLIFRKRAQHRGVHLNLQDSDFNFNCSKVYSHEST